MSHFLGYKSFESSQTEVELTVQGKVPAWLRGTFLRNAPGQYETQFEQLQHWFDGFALLSKFDIHDKGIRYQSKFLNSNAYQWAQKTGKLQFGEFATKPKLSFYQQLLSLFHPRVTDNDNVNTMKIADHLVAFTETYREIKIDLKTLDQLGQMQYNDAIAYNLATPHPHYDFKQNECINLAVKFGKRCYYYFLKISHHPPYRQIIATIPVKRPGYLHSFSITENYCILIEHPFVVNPLHLMYNCMPWGKPYIENYHWRVQQGTRFLLVDRRTGDVVREFHDDAFFMFHTINAYEFGNDIVLDICCYPDPSIINAFYLKRARQGKSITEPGQYRRFILSLQNGRIHHEDVSKLSFDFPRIHYCETNGRQHQYVYGASSNQFPADFVDILLKLDVRNHSEKIWREEGCFVGEPVFVGSPNKKSEDDGVVMTIILNHQKKQSSLLILDATSFLELARADLHHVLPFGLHGQFYEAELASAKPKDIIG